MIALPSALQALDQLDFANPKFYSGYIIQKTTVNCPGAFLASGRFKWNAPISSTDIPTQFFLMYYPIDTNSNNDCLRVIPGSHRKRHRLPDLPPQGTEEIRDTDESHPALQIDPDELNGEAGHSSDARLLFSGFAQPTINCLKRCRPFLRSSPQPTGQLEPCGLGFGETAFRPLPRESKSSASQPNPR